MVLTLYGVDASPPVRAVQMVINKLNVPDVVYVKVDLLKQEQKSENFLKMNPQHSVPTLKDDDFVIWDSHAITAYLVSKYADDDSLNPTEPKQRAMIDQRLHFDSGVLFPALRQTLRPILFDGQKSFKQESLDNISEGYGLIDKFLKRQWLAGDHLTLADICCYATVSTLNVLLPIDTGLYPRLASWVVLCSRQDWAKKCNEPGLAMLKELLKSKLA